MYVCVRARVCVSYTIPADEAEAEAGAGAAPAPAAGAEVAAEAAEGSAMAVSASATGCAIVYVCLSCSRTYEGTAALGEQYTVVSLLVAQ